VRANGFENKDRSKKFGLKSDKLAGKWRKLRKKGLHIMYYLRSTVWVFQKVMRWTEHASRIAETICLCGRPGVAEETLHRATA